ncbi:hypothetical protein ACOZ4I_02500 [Haloarcula salina]|uniref:hypothetical protein n=1 Tax=Haloarcula salina TaxID=1429914 RepID=UPI003C6F2142
MADDGTNRLGDGDATYCDECESPYREIQRLPGRMGLCPTCFEAALGGGRSD